MIKSTFRSGIEICAFQCAEDGKCEAFVFDKEGGFCELMSGDTDGEWSQKAIYECYVKI